MYILGLSFYYHDSAAALLQDGDLVAAAEEERFSRIKHDHDFPKLAIEFCLNHAGITANDLDYVVFYEKPLVKFERILSTSLATYPRSWQTFSEAMVSFFDKKLWIKSLISERMGIPVDKILFTDHHQSHAASAFFASPFEEAAILTLDGVGEWTTASMGSAHAVWEGRDNKYTQNEIILTHEHRFPHSLGLLYSAFTAYLGFQVNEGEYKVMGMSPYGEPRFVDKIQKLVKVSDDGSFWMDMDYFSYHYSPEHTYNDKFVKLFGAPRVHESEFFTPKTNPEVDPNSPKAKENQYYADIAASIQFVTEEIIIKMANALYKQTGSKRLCMAGGVGLNSKANGLILAQTPFEELYIQPAAGDSGGALGAALYVYHVVLGKPRRFIQEHNYWGASYSESEIVTALQKRNFHYERMDDDEKIISRTVDDILAGKVIGWYQGRFEWGPRALGNRSIMADPRRAEMKDIVNSKIKFREPFRPFAPVILEEEASRYFPTLTDPERQYSPRFMLVVYPWDQNLGTQVPAVNHLGTGRLQTVRREWNPRYHRMVEMFGQATGVPVLMNTSFNLRGEPIVTTPDNALNTFSNSGIDTLVMENYYVTKNSSKTG
ncbi:MAG: carbamoyltransferase [Chloroflexota bacterium]